MLARAAILRRHTVQMRLSKAKKNRPRKGGRWRAVVRHRQRVPDAGDAQGAA